jgi:hypothetical protein
MKQNYDEEEAWGIPANWSREAYDHPLVAFAVAMLVVVVLSILLGDPK